MEALVPSLAEHCRTEAPGCSCRGNPAWIHMITFLINFPTPIATMCPLLHTNSLGGNDIQFYEKEAFFLVTVCSMLFKSHLVFP